MTGVTPPPRLSPQPARYPSSDHGPYPGLVSEVPIGEAGAHLAEVAHEAASGGEVVYLTEHGQRLAAIVPAQVAADLEAAEDADDIAAAREAMAEEGEPVPAEELWAELNL